MIIPPNQSRRSTGKNKTIIISPSQPKGGKAKNKSMIMTPSQPKGGKKNIIIIIAPLQLRGGTAKKKTKKKQRNKNYGRDYSGFWIRTDFFSLKFISSLILNIK